MGEGNGYGNGKDEKDHDWSMKDWLLVVYPGSGYLLGKLHGDDEVSLRKQMKDGQVPMVTLRPCYVLDARIHGQLVQQGNQVGFSANAHIHPNRAEWVYEWATSKGIERGSWHGVLSFFQFVSEQSEAVRRSVSKKIGDVDRSVSSRESGLVL